MGKRGVRGRKSRRERAGERVDREGEGRDRERERW